jgi:hypothetical protein
VKRLLETPLYRVILYCGVASTAPLIGGAFLAAKGVHGSTDDAWGFLLMLLMDVVPAVGLTLSGTVGMVYTGSSLVVFRDEIEVGMHGKIRFLWGLGFMAMIFVVPTWMMANGMVVGGKPAPVSVNELLGGGWLAWLYYLSVYLIPEVNVLAALITGTALAKVRKEAADKVAEDRRREKERADEIKREAVKVQAAEAVAARQETLTGAAKTSVYAAALSYFGEAGPGEYRTIGEIVSGTGRSQGALTNNLAKLESEGLVVKRANTAGSGYSWALAAVQAPENSQMLLAGGAS